MLTKKKKNKIIVMFCGPGFAGICLFYIFPLFIMLLYSFISGPVDSKFVWFENYEDVLGNNSFQLAITNTYAVILFGLPLLFLMAYLVRHMLSEIGKRMSNIFLVCFLFPIVIPTGAIVIVLQALFSDVGLINSLLQQIGFEKVSWIKTEMARVMLVLLFLWKNIGLATLFLDAAYKKTPVEIIDVAKTDGADKLQLFFKIRLHYLSSTILFISIFSVLNSFKMFREIYMMVGKHPMSGLYLLQHYLNNLFGKLNYSNMAAASILICIIFLVAIGTLSILEGAYNREYEKDM